MTPPIKTVLVPVTFLFRLEDLLTEAAFLLADQYKDPEVKKTLGNLDTCITKVGEILEKNNNA